MYKTIMSSYILKISLTLSICMIVLPYSIPRVLAEQAISVEIDGQKQVYDQPPIMINDRVFVPLRGIFEALGAKVEWDEATQTITSTSKRQKIVLKVGSQKVTINGDSNYIDPVPQVSNNRTMIPIRAVSQLIGATVTWDGENSVVKISTGNIRLLDAVLDGNVKEINKLVASGIDSNSKVSGISELSYAARYGKIESVKALLTSGANPNEIDFDSWSPLITASVSGTSSVKKLLDAGADPNYRMNYGESALSVASHENYTELVQLLLDAEAEPNVKTSTSNSFTPLSAATVNSNCEMIRTLLAHGANPNTIVNRTSYLLFAAFYNNAGVIRTLLAGGADPNIQDEDGWTPLMIASEHGNIESVQALLDGHADPNLLENHGASALKIAVAHGNTETVNLLIRAGAKLLPERQMDFGIFNRVKIDDYYYFDTDPLIVAVSKGDLGKVRTLLKNGSDPNQRTISGSPALVVAIQYGFTEEAKLLLDSGADAKKDYEGSAWNYAAEANNLEIIKALLPYYSEYDHSDKDGYTTLMMAASKNNTDLIKLLLEHGVSPNTRQKEGLNALMFTASFGHKDAIETLLSFHADPDIQDNDGQTALMHAVITGQPETLKLLLKMGANPNIKEKNGKTALLLATEYGNAELVESLLAFGADPNIQNLAGVTPLQYATEMGYTDIEDLLKKLGTRK